MWNAASFGSALAAYVLASLKQARLFLGAFHLLFFRFFRPFLCLIFFCFGSALAAYVLASLKQARFFVAFPLPFFRFFGFSVFILLRFVSLRALASLK